MCQLLRFSHQERSAHIHFENETLRDVVEVAFSKKYFHSSAYILRNAPVPGIEFFAEPNGKHKDPREYRHSPFNSLSSSDKRRSRLVLRIL